MRSHFGIVCGLERERERDGLLPLGSGRERSHRSSKLAIDFPRQGFAKLFLRGEQSDSALSQLHERRRNR
jgi:hypothetical protein